jgi:hypothetical protein
MVFFTAARTVAGNGGSAVRLAAHCTATPVARPDHHPAEERLPTERRDEGVRRGRGRKGCIAKRGCPRRPCAHLFLCGLRGRCGRVRADHQLPIRCGHRVRHHSRRRQQAGRSPTFSRRSPSSLFSVRLSHQRTRWARLAGFDLARDPFSDWHRPRPRRRPAPRPTSDPRCPESAFRSMRFSRRRLGAQHDFGGPGRVAAV